MPKIANCSAIFSVLLCFLSVAATALPQSLDYYRKQLTETFGEQSVIGVDGLQIRVWLAADPDTQQQGLMHVEQLGHDEGMLFYYPEPRRICMWMKDTPLPLSVAFADGSGVISNIERMKPRTRRPHCSEYKTAVYALEMRRGWYRQYGITADDQLQISPNVESLLAASARGEKRTVRDTDTDTDTEAGAGAGQP